VRFLTSAYTRRHESKSQHRRRRPSRSSPIARLPRRRPPSAVSDRSEGPAFPRDGDHLLARFRLTPADASGESDHPHTTPALRQRHASSGYDGLLLDEDAVVRDRDCGPGDCARNGSQVRWVGSRRPGSDDRSAPKQQAATTGPGVAKRSRGKRALGWSLRLSARPASRDRLPSRAIAPSGVPGRLDS
jgi:hypothetical protein